MSHNTWHHILLSKTLYHPDRLDCKREKLVQGWLVSEWCIAIQLQLVEWVEKSSGERAVLLVLPSPLKGHPLGILYTDQIKQVQRNIMSPIGLC